MVTSHYSPQAESKTIWVFLEQQDGVLEEVSLELLARGRELADQLGWTLEGLLLGQHVAGLAQHGIACGADRIWLAEHALLEHFTIEAFTQVACQLLLQKRPSVFWLGATPNGRDLAGRLAVRLRTGLNADCTDLRIDLQEGLLVCEVSGFGGGVLAMIEMRNHRPQMATVRPGVFALPHPDSTRVGDVISMEIDLDPAIIQTRVIERSVGAGLNLSRVPFLVAGGRGMEGDFKILEQLAQLFEGEVGATRPPVDEGHVERERQVGQTGVVCSPKVALCCGISGAFHFVVGIEKASLVIAINSDPEAPIFEYADYCVVGDVHEVLPELIAVLSGQQVTYA